MRAGALLTVLALTACGPENGLSGSVGELFPLSVSRVEVRRNAEALQVTYLFNRGADIDVVVQVGVALAGVTLKPGVKVPLEGDYAVGHPRTTVLHAPGGEPQRVFPRVHKGDVTLTEGGEVEKPMRGSFSMVFETEGGDLGQGRTLGGTFSSMAMDAGFGPLP